jgi:hypothetical protein
MPGVTGPANFILAINSELSTPCPAMPTALDDIHGTRNTSHGSRRFRAQHWRDVMRPLAQFGERDHANIALR